MTLVPSPAVLHVAQISFYLDPLGREPQRLLAEWPSLVDVAEAARSACARVTVIQAATQTARIVRNDVDYRFIAPERDGRSISTGAPFAAALAELNADVFHVHGFGFPVDALALAELAPATPILVQDHADHPPRIWRRLLWRRALARTAGVAFCARAQAQPFVRLRLLDPRVPVFEIPETSSHFTPGDRDAARQHTDLHGDPCLLWVGHLNANKDPLTVLEAVRSIAPELPRMQLWCCFAAAPLLEVVSYKVNNDPLLQERVHLLGRVGHERIEQLMRAADIFVLGSHREGSGYALIEALACGLPAAVTDIPSFRALTAHGDCGRLWRCANAASLAQALLELARERPSRAQVRAHFDAELSLAAVGRKLLAAYENLHRRATFHVPNHPAAS